MSRLLDRIVFVTGAGGGQGRVAAQMFAAEGATVVGCDIDEAGITGTEKLVRDAGGRFHGFGPVDLGDSAAATAWVNDGVAVAGGIDVLYNNAGAVRFGPIADVSDEDWAFTIRNELDLVLHTTRAAWPHLVARGSGAVVTIASGSGIQGNMVGGAAAHAAAKGGVIALSRQLAAEGAELNIRSNTISPGVIETEKTAALRAKAGITAEPFVPLGRLGRPEDVIHCAIYLASPEAEWVTGANFVIDGGVTAVRPASGR